MTVLPRRSGIWIRICALPRRRLACFSTSSSNALMRAFDFDWRALGDERIHASSSLMAFSRLSSSRPSCAMRFDLASSHAE
jgi:hypothetical protein